MDKDFKLMKLAGVKSPWNGMHYIGFVLDVINEYLGLNAKEYQIEGGTLCDARFGTINGESELKIRVDRIGDESYALRGFPEGIDSSDFEKRAPEILEKILNGKT